MGIAYIDMSMSLDGFVAGPNAGPNNPIGDGGARIHRWVYDLESWRARQNKQGGETNIDDALVRESFERTGAYVMGSRMFAEGKANWPDPPPFQAPVFVLTHTPREPWVRQGGTTFTFVTDGVADALERAHAAAGDKDVRIAGGADTARQCLAAGLVDELHLHLAPVLLGEGVRLFDELGPDVLDADRVASVDAVGSPTVTHLRYRLKR